MRWKVAWNYSRSLGETKAERMGLRMSGENILSGGLDVCKQMRSDVSELYASRTRSTDTEVSAAQTEKAIKAKEKAINDEINTAVKKRQDEIGKSYDDELAKLKSRSRKVKLNKGKTKRKEVRLRIRRETADEREKERQLKLEIRSVYKRENVSSVFNTKLFYSLFMPHSLSDVLVLLLALVIALLAIPSVVYYLVFPETWQKNLWLMLMYFAFALIYILLYVAILHATKGIHKVVFAEIKGLRTQIKENRKEMARIARRIRKDKDESEYNLNHFDDEMKDITEEIRVVLEEKKDALIEFEKSTKLVLADDIREKYKAELQEMEMYLATTREEQKAASARAKELKLLIAKKYEPYLGKENLSLDVIDQLEIRLESGAAKTIGEALKQLQESLSEAESSKPEVTKEIQS